MPSAADPEQVEIGGREVAAGWIRAGRAARAWAAAAVLVASAQAGAWQGDEFEPDGSAGAAEPPVESGDGSDSVSLDGSGGVDDSVDLMFEEFDVVVTASRSERRSALTPVPVSVLGEDFIRHSGVREIPELLAFIPGVDALRVDRNRWAIGVRGLHQTFSDRTLFLLNGRNASNAVFGGVDFQRLPVFLHDLERIETVRGPGGGAWGANAFNGVINVIEKSPRKTTGVLVQQRFNDMGDSRTSFRVGDAADDLAWRFSGEVEEFEDSGEPFVNDGTVVAPAASRDFGRTRKFAFDGVYDVGDGAELEFGAGYSHVERGDAPIINFQPGLDERIDLFRAHTKLNMNPDGETSGYVQWYGTFQDVNRPSLWRYTSYDNTLEGQLEFGLGADHEVTVGSTLRLANLEVQGVRPTDALPSGASAEQWAGVFIDDRWSLSDRWTLESQARLDWYSETELDWAGRVALLRTLGAGRNHTLRLAGAKAFRTPQIGLRKLRTERFPLPGGPPQRYGLHLVPAGEVDNEQIHSLEAGYTGRLSESVTLRLDGYYQHLADLTGLSTLPEPDPMVGREFAVLENQGGAEAIGAEGELVYELDRVRLSAWYAHNRFDFDEPMQNARAFRPARHKAGLTARGRIAQWLTAGVNYRYTDATPGDDTTPGVGSTNRVDLTATVTPPRTHTEVQVGVLDVFDETDRIVFDHVAPGAGHRTPGRSFFAQVRVRF